MAAPKLQNGSTFRSPKRLFVGCIVFSGLTSVIFIYYYGESSVLSPFIRLSQYVSESNVPTSSPKVPIILQMKERRHTILDWSSYSNDRKEDRYIGNCFVTRNKTFLNVSDAVVIVTRKQLRYGDFPKSRHPWQRWVWILDESPFHPFDGNDYNFTELRGLFNWTMTYRSTSDVYIPYGWTVRRAKAEPIPDYIGKQPKLAVAVISNCMAKYVHNARDKYIQELQKYIDVDVFGTCSNTPCPGYSKGLPFKPCSNVKDYLFYLSFENCNCREYISEKSFTHGFYMGTVPVVMGAVKDDYTHITPPNSFIHVNDFKSPQNLGIYLKSLHENRSEYINLHKWRRNFSTRYRLQFIQDEPLWESLCNEMSNSSKVEAKKYPDLSQYWTIDDCEAHKS